MNFYRYTENLRIKKTAGFINTYWFEGRANDRRLLSMSKCIFYGYKGKYEYLNLKYKPYNVFETSQQFDYCTCMCDSRMTEKVRLSNPSMHNHHEALVIDVDNNNVYLASGRWICCISKELMEEEILSSKILPLLPVCIKFTAKYEIVKNFKVWKADLIRVLDPSARLTKTQRRKSLDDSRVEILTPIRSPPFTYMETLEEKRYSLDIDFNYQEKDLKLLKFNEPEIKKDCAFETDQIDDTDWMSTEIESKLLLESIHDLNDDEKTTLDDKRYFDIGSIKSKSCNVLDISEISCQNSHKREKSKSDQNLIFTPIQDNKDFNINSEIGERSNDYCKSLLDTMYSLNCESTSLPNLIGEKDVLNDQIHRLIDQRIDKLFTKSADNFINKNLYDDKVCTNKFKDDFNVITHQIQTNTSESNIGECESQMKFQFETDTSQLIERTLKLLEKKEANKSQVNENYYCDSNYTNTNKCDDCKDFSEEIQPLHKTEKSNENENKSCNLSGLVSNDVDIYESTDVLLSENKIYMKSKEITLDNTIEEPNELRTVSFCKNDINSVEQKINEFAHDGIKIPNYNKLKNSTNRINANKLNLQELSISSTKNNFEYSNIQKTQPSSNNVSTGMKTLAELSHEKIKGISCSNLADNLMKDVVEVILLKSEEFVKTVKLDKDEELRSGKPTEEEIKSEKLAGKKLRYEKLPTEKLQYEKHASEELQYEEHATEELQFLSGFNF